MKRRRFILARAGCRHVGGSKAEAAGLGAALVATLSLGSVTAAPVARSAPESPLRVGGPVLVSADAAGRPAEGWSAYPSISRHGYLVAFLSEAHNLGVPASSYLTVYRKNVHTGAVRLVTRDLRGRAAEGSISSVHQMSGDGNRIIFSGSFARLVPGVGESPGQTFLRNLRQQTTRLVSAAPDGAPGNDESRWADISNDGEVAAFSSRASNLVPGDRNGRTDVFARRLQTGRTTLVSARPDGRPGNGESEAQSLSADGFRIAFTSTATDLVAGGPDGRFPAAYVRHMPTGTTRWVGRQVPTPRGVARIVISWTGDRAALGVDGALWVVGVAGQERPVRVASRGWVSRQAFSADGRLVAYRGPGDRCSLLDLETEQRVVLSRSRSGEPQPCHDAPTLSADGRFAAFAARMSSIDPSLPSAEMGVFRVPLYRDGLAGQ